MSQITVLIIDDEIHMLRLIQRILEDAGFRTIGSNSGNHALTLLQDPNTKPDVITCDVSLPGMDGFEILSMVKSDTNLQDIPVVMLTAMGRQGEASRAKEMGASDYLTKPFSAISLIDVLRKQVKNNKIRVVVKSK